MIVPRRTWPWWRLNATTDYSYRARHCKARESYIVVKATGSAKKRLGGLGVRLFRGFEHVPQVDECCLTCVIFIYVCRLRLRVRRLRRLAYVAKLGGGEDSVSGVTSARAHLV